MHISHFLDNLCFWRNYDVVTILVRPWEKKHFAQSHPILNTPSDPLKLIMSCEYQAATTTSNFSLVCLNLAELNLFFYVAGAAS